MANGVEVIVADGKSTLPGEPNFFRILANNKNYNRPLTLAPSTLNNVMMLMTLGNNPKLDNIPEDAILNRFITKTCLTTYTYLTTYKHNGSTTIESREKVISNIATEERNTQNLTPLIASDMTFFKTPNLKVGQFSTTYTYYNTIMDDDIPIVATSKHVVVNTITAADDYLKMIRPSPSALPVYETNTYYSTVEFSKTINDDAITKVINTQDVITQVIVTESLPHGRMPMSMSHEVIDQSEEDEFSASDYSDEPEAYGSVKKTNAIDVNPTKIEHKPAGNTAVPLHLYATKTYLTTFTYFTTLLQNAAGNGKISTTVDSHTRVIENVITESIASSMIPSNILSNISKNLFSGEKNDLKTRIVLNNGQKLEITAANILKPVEFATKLSSLESNDLEVAGNELSPSTILLSSEEAENFVSEPISSEEIVQQQPIKLPTKNTRPKPVSTNTGSGSLKIPSLLNSITMPNFSALGPVINAMAGLLQNNFGTQTPTRVEAPLHLVQHQPPNRIRPIVVENANHPQHAPQFSQESQDLILGQTDAKNSHPLYIPVRDDIHHVHHHMMGSGIAISPGEVITANSDVIVGKPAVIGPKLPPNVNKPVEIVGMDVPPPFVPMKTPQRPSSFVKDIKNNGNINMVTIKKGDDYVGPVPPKEIHITNQQQHKPIPLNNFQRPPQNLQKIQPIIPPMMRPQQSDGHQPRPLINNLLPKPSPTQESQINNNYVKINHQVNHQVHPHHHSFNKNQNRHHQGHQTLQQLNQNQLTPQKSSQNQPPPLNNQFQSNPPGLNHQHLLNKHQNGPNNQGGQKQYQNVPNQQQNDQNQGGPNKQQNGPKNQGGQNIQQQNGPSLNQGVSNKHQNGPIRQQGGQNPQQNVQIQQQQVQSLQNFNRNQNHNQQNPTHLFRNPGPPQENHGNFQENYSNFQQNKHQHNHHNHPQRPHINESPPQGHLNVQPPKQPTANVIEIQKIPEVYSTDLPIITINNQHNFKPSPGSQIVTHELPEILEKPTRGQPLLVDIQPSQVANVVIPHGSSSIFVFGGVHKAHKVGQYFNEPSPHENAEVGIKSVNLLTDVEGSKYQGQRQQQNNGPHVHYDLKDNIIVASENVPVPSIQSTQGVNVLLGSNIQPTYSRPPHDFLHHSVNVVPNTVIRFHPDSGENYNYPSTQQLINQQKIQQIQIDQQLRQKQADNQKRQEIENQRRQEFAQNQKIQQQKRKEFEDQKKRKEMEEQQHLQQIELDRKRDYERQQQRDYELRQKLIEQKQQEMEQQKHVKEQKLKQQYEKQQKIQHEMKMRHQYEQQQSAQQDANFKQQPQQNFNFNVRQPYTPANGPDTGFIILSSDYNNQNNPQHTPLNNQQGPFVPLPSQQTPSQKMPMDQDTDNETDSDGQAVQESIIRPKLPSGQNHESIEDEDIRVADEYDNFVYHKLTEQSTMSTEGTSTTASTTTTATSQKPLTSTPQNRRTSYVPVLNERFTSTTERTRPIYMPKPYPNLQFDNLPKSVNELQPPPVRQQNNYQRVPTIGITPNYKNTLSQSMQPPAPPKFTRRPTSPFHKTTFKISMPINPMPDDDQVSNLQTEEPFNPKFTEDFSTKPSLTTQPTVANTTTSMTTQESTTQQSSTTPTRSPPASGSDLNIGEVETKSRNRTEALDIFDSKESINPHNHGFIKHSNEKDDMDLIPPSIRKPYQTIVRAPESTTYSSTGIRLEISSVELENMKPPAPAFVIPGKTNAPQFDEIVNMKPPTVSPNEVEAPKVRPPYVTIQRPTQRPTISLSRFTSPPNYVAANRSRSPTTRSPLRTRPTTQKPAIFDVVLQFKQGADKQEPIKNNEDVLVGSVEAVDNGHVLKSSINATPALTEESTKIISTTPTNRGSVSFTSSSIRQQVSFTRSRVPATTDDKKLLQNRTKSFLDPIKVSTKYITNTKTITLAKTKTEVINRSHGVPITTTRVQTATVFETITETETLLRPTIITSIQPTATYTDAAGTSATHHPTTTEEIVEGFVSDEDTEEFIINYDDNRNDSTIHRANEQPPSNPAEHESIFVVMTDKKKGSVFNIDPSVITPVLHNRTESNEIDDVSRGEEDTNDGADHILLGGILIASPPQLDKSQTGAAISSQCLPECKSGRNEYCHRVQGHMRCICRPGFARMFPDRPCKPIYTYIMKIGLSRNGNERLTFDRNLADKNSTSYTALHKVTHDGVDRMLMQSDLRDIYHSVDVIGFNSSKVENGVIGKMFIQLSENTNEKKLKETVKKYLRLSNFNLGGTDLYANPLTSELETYDFDECSGDDKNHDCSENSHCFNLLGTYTCSCKEAFTDESVNPIYPGRICVPEKTGCEKCHYHGTCMTKVNDQVTCECFQWYAGKSCQVNLKMLLFALVVIGTTLFMLLMICLIVTCVKRKRVNQNAIAPTMNIIQRRISASAHQSVSSHADRKAMIQDTSSETSLEPEPIPYFRKKSNDENIRKLSVEAAAPKKKKSTTNNPLGSFSKATMEQRDRSLTVMIPRAKYHPQGKQGNLIDVEGYKSKSTSTASVNQTKLLNYLDASPSSPKNKNNVPCENLNYQQPHNSGALVSAGFKVSAAGGSGSPGKDQVKNRISKTTSHLNVNEIGAKYYAIHKISTMSEQPPKLQLDEKSQISVVRKSYSHGNLIDPMEDWLENGNNTEAMSEARSYDETTIQAPTKAIRNIYFKQPSQHTNEEMNTMAERDLGSTVLLPHTHLYKPTTDRGSDISGFDSL